MGTLKSSDILGEISGDTSVDMKKVEREKAQEIGSYKPSPYQVELRAKLRDKVQCNIGQIPRFIFDQFERLVIESGMNKREYFYHLIREKGAEIPPYHEMDGRKL